MTIRGGWPPQSQAAAAPERPARRAAAGRIRILAGILLLSAPAGAGALGAYAWRHRMAPVVRDPSPFALSDAVWRAVQSTAHTRGQACPPRTPVAVLYVSRSCVHCEAELQRWAGLLRRSAPELNCVAIAVVAPIAQSSAVNDWLPAELAKSLLWDRDGSVARALDARLVPVAAFVTSEGVVRARTVGESSENATLERLRRLAWLSTINSRGH